MEIIVNDTAHLSFVITNVNCFNGNNGAIDIEITNNPNRDLDLMTYSWSNAEITQDISNLVAGTHTVTVITGNNYTLVGTYIVTEPDVLSAGTNGTLTICAGTTVTDSQLFDQLGGSPNAGMVTKTLVVYKL